MRRKIIFLVLLVCAVPLLSVGCSKTPEAADPQQATAKYGEPYVQSIVIDNALRAVDASLTGPLGAVAGVSVIVDQSHALDRVIALGTPALPQLISRIDNSSENGLHEAILAIGVCRIIKADLGGPPDTGLSWSTGKEFPAVWKTYLARIPEAVSLVAKSDATAEERNARLVKLGTPAIPFILDEVEKGRSELSPAAESLIKGTVEMGGASAKGLVTAEWAGRNRARFAELREMVSAAKQRLRLSARTDRDLSLEEYKETLAFLRHDDQQAWTILGLSGTLALGLWAYTLKDTPFWSAKAVVMAGLGVLALALGRLMAAENHRVRQVPQGTCGRA